MINLTEKKKCKPGGHCCKKCKRKHKRKHKRKIGLGWGNPDFYGATPVGGSSGGDSGGAMGESILESLLREYIKKFI